MSNKTKPEARQRARRAHYVDDPVESESEKQAPMTSDNSYDLFTVTESGQNPIIVQVTVNQTPIQMELDTGASLSLINKQTFDVIADHRGKVSVLDGCILWGSRAIVPPPGRRTVAIRRAS